LDLFWCLFQRQRWKQFPKISCGGYLIPHGWDIPISKVTNW
jgi:hypothetical protein